VSLKDYILDEKDKKVRGPFLSVCITIWLLICNSLAWIPFIPDHIIERAAAYLIGVNTVGLALIGMYWVNKFKQEQLEKYVDFANKTNGFSKK
jgi:F0F1-type ATP synthase membrane subunit a